MVGGHAWSEAARYMAQAAFAVDAKTGIIVAQVFTDQHTDDTSQVAPLLNQVENEIGVVMPDGAYDGVPNYQAIALYGEDIEVIIPPLITAVSGG